MRKAFASVLFLLASLTPVIAQGFNPAGAPPWVFANNYGLWAFQGQAANTYTFTPLNSVNGCQVTQLDFQNKPTFNPFSNTVALAPVLISDINSANSEVVTPGSAFTVTSTTCGANLSPVHSHTTFTMQSGTGGLQEALNAVGGSTQPYPSVVFLTPEWYKLISGISSLNATLSATTPQSVIANAVCSTGAFVYDITTEPWTEYACSGGVLTPTVAPASLPNFNVSSNTQIAVPTALTTVAATCATNGGGCITTATTGGTIPASSAYTLGATCVDGSGGETTLSVDTAAGATVTTGSGTATNTISVTSPAGCTVANGAVGWRLYMTAASGASLSEILYSPTWTPYASNPLQAVFPQTTVIPIGSTATITAIITGTATVPATATAYPRIPGASGSYPPFTALGTVATTVTGTLGLVNFPAGYLNKLGRQVTFCGNAYATQNGTGGGTLALKFTLASIPGVTLITPITLTSGAPTLSTQDPINFCVTFTTAVVGTSGKLEAHGWMGVGLAGTTVMSTYNDLNFTVSSAIDLTKQDQLGITITPTTTGLTAAQLRQLSEITTN